MIPGLYRSMVRAIVSLSVLILSPAAAWATGSLTISLQDERSRPVEGTVSVAPQAGGAAQNCATRAGQCTVRNLAAGAYRVTASTLRGQAPPATVVSVRNGLNARARLTVPLPPAIDTPMTQSTSGRPSTPQAGAGSQGSTQPGSTAGAGPGVTVVRGAPGQVSTLRTVVPAGTQAPPLAQGGPRTGGTVVATTVATQTHNLGSGQRRVISGFTNDQRSRPVEGTVTVSKNGVVVGTVATRGGAFQVYDLAPGQYRLNFTCLTGQSTAANLALQNGPTVSVRLTVQR